MSAGKVVSASLVVSFSSSAGDALVVEVDERPTGYNDGETVFYAGDSPAFLVYAPHGYVIRDIQCTEGSIQHLGAGTLQQKEWLNFPRKRAASTQYPIYPGSLEVQKRYGEAQGAEVGYDDSTVSLPAAYLAVLQVEYTAAFMAYRLVGASGDAPVIVYVVAEKP